MNKLEIYNKDKENLQKALGFRKPINVKIENAAYYIICLINDIEKANLYIEQYQLDCIKDALNDIIEQNKEINHEM